MTRKRDGASYWRLYRDLVDPDIYVERFIVHSWTEYLRQLSRSTMADRISEEYVRTLHHGNHPIRTAHFIAETAAGLRLKLIKSHPDNTPHVPRTYIAPYTRWGVTLPWHKDKPTEAIQ
ncbi:hypothetical protein D3878_17060 [Noviherbaspirillum sedimenti]|uniref:Uncharacterized protein n=1 Tax=Noviherbaspirillum sedimenti TaxID=2320865 RepID=A0A3A3G5Y0_9BURK|nr:hypothetical protein D3878_17060 [Noviherbaspirillum sedimenti]